MTRFLPRSPAARRALWIVLTVIVAVAAAAALVLNALNENISFYKTPTEVTRMAASDTRIRLGGLVAEGSIKYNGITVTFDVTDTHSRVTVKYDGIVPDLFRDGQGIVAEGVLNEEGAFIADTLLARHDENYMPPEVAKALNAASASTKDGAK